MILARIAGGEQVVEIARAFKVSRSFFARLLHEDRARHELVSQAREVAADALLKEQESTIAALVADATSDERQHAKLPADSPWLAAEFSSQEYGDSNQAPVAVSLGQLHLEALLVPLPASPARAALPTELEHVEQPKDEVGDWE